MHLKIGPMERRCSGVPGVTSAFINRQDRDTVLVMHRPRIRFLPGNLIPDTLYRVPPLNNKWLVTSVHTCPTFSMYSPNKCGVAFFSRRVVCITEDRLIYSQ